MAAARLLVDTGVLIAIRRGRLSVDTLDDHDDVAVAAISIAELVQGAHLQDEPRRQEWLDHATAIRETFQILAYEVGTAVQHGQLMAETRLAGRTRGAADLMIAAHARQSSRVLVTRDAAARFDELTGVRARVV